MDNYLNLFYELKRINAVSNVWEYVLIMLKNEYQASDDALKLFCLFFSLIDDGNICISLNATALKEKWNTKLDGLDADCNVSDFDAIIENGIAAIKKCSGTNPLIFNYSASNTDRNNNMFVIHNDWLFTEKFFAAKQDIEDSVNHLFLTGKNSDDDNHELKEIIKKYPRTYELDDKQTDAIIRAKNGENLIITGGPGTGKTTVIYYLLLELLAENKSCRVFMAAPSGKAAERMKESLAAADKRLDEKIKTARREQCEILSNVKPVTLHRLLGLNGSNLQGTKNFPDNSIFVIDEASMIDITIFAGLLKTIKQCHNARVFILGDKDQLPSVQPGAVFADLTQTCKHCLIALTKSQRFPENSDIYKLKEYVRQPDKCSAVLTNWNEHIPDNWAQILTENTAKKYPVQYLTLSNKDDVQTAAAEWYSAFYDNADYNKVYCGLDLKYAGIIDVLDAIWSHMTKAKILCAENHGLYGTENINGIICRHVKTKYCPDDDNNGNFFTGEQIILTKNQGIYDLSNGDIGIIVRIDNKKYMMIQRDENYADAPDDTTDNMKKSELILHKGRYVFYPLYLLPSDAMSPAYAITIHKSQGSEYDNVLVFLPMSEKSPLLNRQILYTAITRTKNATYIISNENNMTRAINTPLSRDTRLFL